MGRRGIALIPALAALLLISGAARAGELTLAYDFYAGGIQVMEVGADASLNAAQYTAHAWMRAEGSLARLYEVNFSFAAEGVLSPSPQPRVFNAVYTGMKGNPAVYVPFRADGSAPETPPPLLRGANQNARLSDPLTAALSIVLSNGENPCGRTYDLYDGLRVFRLVLDTAETNRVERYNQSLFEGDAERCAWRYELVAAQPGDWAIEWFGKTPPYGKIWVAPWPGQPGNLLPVKLLASTPVINVVIHLREASLDGKKVAPN